MNPIYVTVAIPYVNADPHLGYAYELVLADIHARARRVAGDGPVRFLGGTDDYSLKNVLAAEAASVPTARFVDEHGERFQELSSTLNLSFDDFIRTSSDVRHIPAAVGCGRESTGGVTCTRGSTTVRTAWVVSSSTSPRS